MSYSDEKSLPQPAFYMMNCLRVGPWGSLAPHFKDFGGCIYLSELLFLNSLKDQNMHFRYQEMSFLQL